MLTPGERNAVNQSSAAQVASMKSTKNIHFSSLQHDGLLRGLVLGARV